MRLAEEGCRSATASHQSVGLCVYLWWGTAFSWGQCWLRQRSWHRTCPPSSSSQSLISGPWRSLLVQLCFCFWTYFLVQWAVLGCLNSKLLSIRYGMSGCNLMSSTHVEDLPGLFTFNLFVISVKKRQLQNLNFPPSCSQVSQVMFGNRKLFCIKVRLCF